MKFAILGPESTGKTTTALELTKRLNGVFVPEAARVYLSEKGLNYRYEDILEIAKLQLKTELEVGDLNPDKFVVCDTELITIEIWLEFYGYEIPNWISDYIHLANYEKYFLFDTDVEWKDDALRNNPHDRSKLLEMFVRKLSYYNKNWEFVKGQREERLEQILQSIHKTSS